MLCIMKFVAFALLSVLSVSATTFNVAVGDNNGLVYNPPFISGAKAGDQIVFKFTSKNHTVTQSTFTNPCVKASSTAIDSGFKPAMMTPQPTFTITLNPTTASAPLWFFCAQTNPANHCHAGMVFAINPSATKTFAQYQATAKNSGSNSTTPPAPAKSTNGNKGTVHTVIVGQNQTLTFSPSSIQAMAGDTVAFTFVSKNHSATQSTFTNPCALAPGGVDSGFHPIPANSTTAAQWSITLDAQSVSAPLWFFCAQTIPAVHCHAGMVFAINPTANKTFAQFQNNAKNSTNSGNTASGTTASSSAGAPSSTASSTDAGSPTDSSSGGATSTDGSTSSAPTSTSTKSASNGAAPGLHSSVNVGLVVSIVGLVVSLSF
jgi:plastocyanin